MTMKRRILSVALVLLLVTGSGLSPVGTALAAEQGNCSSLDDFVMFLTLGAVNAEDCSRAAYVDDAVQDMKESDQNQTKVDIYSAASGAKSARQAWSAPYDNYLSDSKSVAWMKVEKAVAEAYKNGSSKAEAKVAAREAISNYYATKQKNLIERYNVTVSEFYTLYNQAEQESIPTGISGAFLYEYPDGTEYIEIFDNPRTETLTLVNASKADSKAIVIGYDESDQYADGTSFTAASGTQEVQSSDGAVTHTVEAVRVRAPNSNYDDMTYLRFNHFGDRWSQIQTMNDNLQSEAENFVNATYQDFESGTVNASDVVSSHTAMFEYGVRSGNESEGLWRSTAALAMMGYDTPDLNSSGTMTVEYRNANYTGVVLAQNAPGGNWSVGTTYNTSSIEGPVFMATTEGEKIDFGDGETFTVTGMTAKDGTQINSTQTTKYVYKTSNTSELLALQEELTELRQEIEDRETSGGGGSDGNSGFSNKEKTIGLVALVAIVLLVGGGKRRG
jgi:hypothetical protein